ncbi:monocarboxylate permease-like protein [Truncatella angustata]|uniref:Monocarboxylate permease-like protein n=1 Tax=Truncatella angustata TaxID=152316 RepID=A0A9P8UCF8_9PEZI|nr:monocarboxylate permease-like protein [Truncatella angustata]KAH6646160.1 monocarboxylate permease-like protein [Truncatella angustata]
MESSSHEPISGPASVKGKVSATSTSPEDKYPEGGAEAWGVAIGTSLSLFCTLGYVNSFGVYQAYYMHNQLSDEDPSHVSWIGSLQFFLVFAVSIFGGPLFDRFGAKIIIPSAIAYVFSIMMTSLAQDYYQFMLAQGILGGITSGLVLNPAMAATSQYFDKNRGAAIGLAIAGSSLGGVVIPLALSRMLANESLGFGWAVRIIGFISVALLAVACILVKERLPPRKKEFFLLKAFAEKKYIWVTISGFFLFLGMFTPYFFLPDYALSRGMDPLQASYLIAILNGTSFPGRVIPGILSDKFGRFNMYAIASVATSILLFCWTQCTSHSAIYAFTVLYGFFSGGIVSGNSISLASTTDNPTNIGTYMGQAMPIISLASLIGPPISGAFLAAYQGYQELAIFSGVACIIGFLSVLMSKSTTREGLLGLA